MKLAVKACALCSALLAASCARDSIYLRGVRPLNPNSLEQSTSVMVRIFYLTAQEKFLRSDFDGLWHEPEETLGDDKAGGVLETIVLPGTKEDKPTEVQLGDPGGQVNYLGLLANFRERQDGKAWRIVEERDAVKGATFRLTGYRIERE